MRYSMEIGQILKTQPIFDFYYDFYDENCKSNFEKKFLDYFYFREIGHETIARFKKSLNTKLNVIMPYYVELYKTMLRTKGIDFMLNKDLVESYQKEINDNVENKSNGVTAASGTLSKNEVSNGTSNNTTKTLDTPQGNISNLDNYLSGATKYDDNSRSDYNSTQNDTNNISSTNSMNENKNTVENYTFKSQGNIGVTSSAELLEKWRRTIINIDKLIIDELDCLFMGIY